MSRRWRYPRNRRGDFFDIPRVTPQPIDWTRRTPRRGLPIRRGEFLTGPPPQVQQAAPPAIPAIIRQRPRAGARLRRGVYWPAAPASGWSSDTLVSATRTRSLVARRGRFLWSPQGPPPAMPRAASRRTKSLVTRHGRFLQVPPVAAPVVTPWPPGSVQGRRVRSASVRRSRFQVFPPAGQIPIVPAVPPGIIRSRLRPATRRRCGRFFLQPAPQIAPQPSVWQPETLSGRRRPWRPVRRGCYFEPPWLGLEVPVPETSRGDMHNRARAGSGATGSARPGAGVAAGSRVASEMTGLDRRATGIRQRTRTGTSMGGGQ